MRACTSPETTDASCSETPRLCSPTTSCPREWRAEPAPRDGALDRLGPARRRALRARRGWPADAALSPWLRALGVGDDRRARPRGGGFLPLEPLAHLRARPGADRAARAHPR